MRIGYNVGIGLVICSIALEWIAIFFGSEVLIALAWTPGGAAITVMVAQYVVALKSDVTKVSKYRVFLAWALILSITSLLITLVLFPDSPLAWTCTLVISIGTCVVWAYQGEIPSTRSILSQKIVDARKSEIERAAVENLQSYAAKVAN